MILVFGGTTEGKKVAGILEKEGCGYFYSTKTKTDFQPGRYARYRFGAFSKKTLADFCISNNVQIIIHAGHPFAEELHQTIHQASAGLNIPVLRFERKYPLRINHERIKYLPAYQDVMDYLRENNIQNLLALTGVQSIAKLKPYWQEHHSIFRILPRESSVSIARQAGFPTENLLLEMPGDDIQHELSIIKKHQIQCVLTKESGESGFLSTKIEAALQANIRLLIIERPILPGSFITADDEEKLMTVIFKKIK